MVIICYLSPLEGKLEQVELRATQFAKTPHTDASPLAVAMRKTKKQRTIWRNL